MSYTLKVSNGDLDFNIATGKIKTVKGIEKLGQDIGESLLINYDADRNYGSKLFEIQIPSSILLAKGEVTRAVSDVINRLQGMQATQNNLTRDEEIENIEQLIVLPGTEGDVFFYLIVRSANGENTEKLMQAGRGVELTQLNHLLPANYIERFGGIINDT